MFAASCIPLDLKCKSLLSFALKINLNMYIHSVKVKLVIDPELDANMSVFLPKLYFILFYP